MMNRRDIPFNMNWKITTFMKWNGSMLAQSLCVSRGSVGRRFLADWVKEVRWHSPSNWETLLLIISILEHIFSSSFRIRSSRSISKVLCSSRRRLLEWHQLWRSLPGLCPVSTLDLCPVPSLELCPVLSWYSLELCPALRYSNKMASTHRVRKKAEVWPCVVAYIHVVPGSLYP